MPAPSRRCTARTASDRPCRAWAVAGSSPPRCSAHLGRPQGGRTEPDDEEAATVESIGDVIRDLAAKQRVLSHLINQSLDREDLVIQELARLLAIHSQNASRLGRLLRDQQALADPAEDLFKEAINFALDSLSEEWGVEL